jgi:diazepam-binding inhibitor (GABA receptor modulating acyl-CoA-binding protein)
MSSELFELAVCFVKTKKSDTPVTSTNEKKLKMYGLYKQATVGPCSQHGGQQPWLINVEARAKWDSWKGLGETSKEGSMKQYIEILDELVPGWH